MRNSHCHKANLPIYILITARKNLLPSLVLHYFYCYNYDYHYETTLLRNC
jgi:hypothetical protein